MKNILKFDHCFGCGVCAAACPNKVITVHVNHDGFYQPMIKEDKCVECGICLKVCAFNHKEVSQEHNEPYSVAAWSNNEEVRYRCTSGGAAFEIERLLLLQGYKVSGVRYNITEQKAEHFIASTIEELKSTIGSKYIQSDTFPSFSQFRKDEKYAVIGTPCQIDSVRRWIKMRKWEDNFVLIDLFCHSVPSLTMWHKYLAIVDVSNPNSVTFRDKRNGWQDSYAVTVKDRVREWFSPLSQGDLFYAFFLGDRCPNECCVQDCKYKQSNSAADVRVGDLWSSKYESDQKGVNALIGFTPKGIEIIKQLSGLCHLEECSFAEVAEQQMKTNCTPRRSWNYVRKALQSNKSLPEIYKGARRVELPDTLQYYCKRILQKLHIKK